MKVQAIGVIRMSGIGKESKKPYDFAQLFYLRPIEPTAKETFQLAGYGYEVAKLDMELAAVSKFSRVAFPAHLELETIQEPGRSGIRVLVSGFKAEKAAA
ncbi:hypothetical protein ACLSSQ_09175 [Azospira sp. APE16]|uniref:hypothetical protein n=1 Tax=Azospira sp. APE16 TaxID=3394231 RepID=UPI003A4D3E22